MSRRLEKILEAIPRCGTLCDVGCDHGYVGLGALERGLADKVIFVDISSVCLEKARKNCPATFQGSAQFECRDGLGDLSCDCAVIAGMGGLEIISILSNAKSLPDKLVLQPMRNQYDLRKFIAETYRIDVDYKFYDGKYYDLILASKSGKPSAPTEYELYFGKDNLCSPDGDFADYLNNEKNKLIEILQNCDDADVNERLKRVEAAIALIKEKIK